MNNSLRKHPKIFYGWWIVIACFFINVFVIGIIHFGFTAFFQPIANDFGWSYTQVSLATSLRGMESSILAPLAGLAVDRLGPRKLAFGGAIIIFVGLFLLSRVTTLAMFYGVFIIIVLGMSTCTGVILLTAVSHWFRRRLSLVMGISACGIATGGLMIPLETAMIDNIGWRMTILILGAAICVIVMALSLVLRDKPEQYGYVPDGIVETLKLSVPDINAGRLSEPKSDLTRKQVLTSRTFWYLAVSYVLCFLTINAVVTHIMPFLSSVGISRSTASFLASAIPLVTIVGRLGFGWLGDKFISKRLITIANLLVCLGMGILIFVNVSMIWVTLPFIILFSIGYGGNAIMMPVLVKNYFGSRNFGTVLGFLMGVAAVGQVLGSPIAGWVYDIWGDYRGVWIAFMALLAISAFIIAATPSVKIKTLSGN
jgi:MFS family permease